MPTLFSGRVVGIAVLAGLSAACAWSKPDPQLSPCDTITGIATNYGRAATLRLAETNFKAQAPTIRGELFGSGVRRIRVIGQRRTCEPYSVLGGSTGLVTCRVQARVCGRYNAR